MPGTGFGGQITTNWLMRQRARTSARIAKQKNLINPDFK
jgi:hypothetical protein